MGEYLDFQSEPHYIRIDAYFSILQLSVLPLTPLPPPPPPPPPHTNKHYHRWGGGGGGHQQIAEKGFNDDA